MERIGYWPKVIRAEELFNAIRAERDLYAETDPYRAVGKFEDDGARYVVRSELRERPSMRLALLIGECAFQMRSAFDHLAAALVERAGATPTEDTQFPVRLSKFNQKRTKVLPTYINPRVSKTALALVDGLQPYHREDRGEDPREDPLAILNSLCVTDKHRMLVVTQSYVHKGLVTVRAGSVFLNAVVNGRFDDGAELASFDATPAHFMAAGCASTEEVQVNAYGRLLVTFDEPDPPRDEPVLDVLANLIAYTSETIQRIETLCGLPWTKLA